MENVDEAAPEEANAKFRVCSRRYPAYWKTRAEIAARFPAPQYERWDWRKEVAGVYDTPVDGHSKAFPDQAVLYEWERVEVAQVDGPDLRFVSLVERINQDELRQLDDFCPCTRCSANPLFWRECDCCVGCLRSGRPSEHWLDDARRNQRAGLRTNRVKREHVAEFCGFVGRFCGICVLAVLITAAASAVS